MKKIILHIFFLFFCVVAFTQVDVYNKGITITIKSGTTVHIDGGLTQAPKDGTHPEIVSEGEVYLTGDLDNQTEKNIFTNAGTVVFYGDSAQAIKGDSSIYFYGLKVNKGNNEVTLEHDIKVTDTLDLISGNVHLNTFDIDLSTSGILNGEDNDNRVYGDNGVLKATRTLTGNTGNIAGLGFEIESNVSLGTSVIQRGHSTQAGASTGSIFRFYKITTTNTGDILDAVKFTYLDDNEFNGLTEAKFTIWQSDNNGIVWDLQESNPSATDQLKAENIEINASPVLFTVAESTCLVLPTVDLGQDTFYLCETDTLELDAQNPGLFYYWSTTENTQQIELTTGGEYHVAVRDANGCVGYDTVQVIEKPYPVVDFDVVYVCQDDSTEFKNTSSISSDTMSFSWDFGDPLVTTDSSTEVDPSFLYDTLGVYTVSLTATSDYNCVATKNETYVVHPLPELALTVNDDCLDVATLFTNNSTVLASQGAFSYSIPTYSYDFGVTGATTDVSTDVSPSYLYTAAGTYQVQLIGETNSGCRDTLLTSVTIHPRAVVDFDYIDVCQGVDVNLSNLSTLSTGAMTYTWDFADGLFSSLETPSKTYTTAGGYDVKLKVTTDYSCEDSVTKQIEVFEIPVASFAIRDTCESATAYIENLSTVASTDVLSYTWSLGDGSSSSVINPTKSYLGAGDYTVGLDVISDKGCTASTSNTMTIHPNPIVDFDFLNVCEGNDVTFQNFSQIATGGVSYTWDFDNGNTSNFKNPIEEYTLAGTYAVELTAKSTEGCVSVLSQDVEIYDLPTIALDDDISTCSGSYVLDAENVGSTYIWSDNSTNQTLTITNPGNYSVQVTNANGCVSSKQVAVALNSTFTPSLGADVSACDTHTLDAGNLGSQSYLWSTGETGKQITVASSGEYIVDIIDQNGCAGADTIEVVINTSPTVDLGNTIDFCDGNSGVIDAQNVGNSYLWSTAETSQTITVTTAGTYSVEVTTPENCTATGQVDVLVNSLPQVDLGNDQTVCASTTLDAQNSGLTFLWSDNSVDQILFVDQAGEYWVQVTDGLSCSAKDTITIAIAPKPVVDLGGDQTVCNGDQVDLDAGTDGDTYLWQNNTTNQTLSVASTGTYIVQVTNSFNCTSTDTSTITVEDKVNVELGSDVTACRKQTLELDAGYTGSTYEWGSNVGFSSTDQLISVADSGTYWVTVTTANLCVGLDTITVSFSEDTITAEFLSASTINVGDTLQFISITTPESVVYTWDFDDGVTSAAEDPEHIFLTAKTHQVTLEVSNEYCTETVMKEILVLPLKEEPDGPFVGAQYNEIVRAEVYPVPTDGEFTVEVELEKEATVYLFLYDNKGHKIDVRTVEADFLEETYNISNLASALYLLKVVVGENTEVIKIVKY